MKQFFSWDGSLLRGFDKVGKVILLSLYWLVCSLPIVSIGWSGTALYYACVKGVRHDRGYVSKEFFGAIKREWKQGLLFSLVYLLAIALLVLDCIVWFGDKSRKGLLLFFVCATLLIIVMVTAVYTFSLISRFEMSIRDVIKLSFFLSFKYLPSSIGIGLVLAASGCLIYASPYFVLFLPGTACIVISLLTERIYQKLIPEPEGDSRQWYDKEEKEDDDAYKETT